MEPRGESPFIACMTKHLPGDADDEAVRPPPSSSEERSRLALLLPKRWPSAGVELTVSFLESRPAGLRREILEHMNAWSERAHVRFVETNDVGHVRIAFATGRDGGYWSYIGTDILRIEPAKPTMNLQGFTERTPDAELRRVVRHETGHTLGFPHEHMRAELIERISREKAFDYYYRAAKWSRAQVEKQVLTPLEQESLLRTDRAEETSIMCYHVPGELTLDGVPIRGGTDITPSDHAFAARCYPKPRGDAAPPRPSR